MVNIFDLKPGDAIRLKNGSVCEVVENMEDGMWVMVRYLSSPSDPSMEGEEELCHAEQVVETVPQ